MECSRCGREPDAIFIQTDYGQRVLCWCDDCGRAAIGPSGRETLELFDELFN